MLPLCRRCRARFFFMLRTPPSMLRCYGYAESFCRRALRFSPCYYVYFSYAYQVAASRLWLTPCCRAMFFRATRDAADASPHMHTIDAASNSLRHAIVLPPPSHDAFSLQPYSVYDATPCRYVGELPRCCFSFSARRRCRRRLRQRRHVMMLLCCRAFFFFFFFFCYGYRA